VENKYKPKSVEELTEFIQSKVTEPHDYDTASDAMWQVALAAFNFVAHELGTTGFQASSAELMFLAKSRRIDGPFAIIEAKNMLFPQYDIESQVENYLDKWSPWAAQRAKELLETSPDAVPRVREHWQMLAQSV
jgi:hypothetical protein